MDRWDRDPLHSLLELEEAEKAARGLTHTPREIAQQPETWLGTFLTVRQQRTDLQDFFQAAGLGPDVPAMQRPIVYLIGAGTSDYIGQALVPLLRQQWQCEVEAVASTDLLPGMDHLLLPEKKYLWISFSRSGDSPEGVAALKKALRDRPDIHHLVVSCHAQGQMAQALRGDPRGRVLLLDDAVNDRGLAMTSSFSNMVVCGQCLAHLWDLEQYGPVLHALVTAGEQALGRYATLASRLAQDPYTRACFVGTGALKAVARESALKVLEMSAGKIVTMAESTLGLRHGPLAAVQRETLFVCYLSSDGARQRYEIDLLEELGRKDIVQTRVAVGLEGAALPIGVCEHCLTPGVPVSLPDACRPPLDVLFGQLLGLFFSLRCHLRPDAPSPTGAIHRVVQGVSIHD